MTFALGSVGPLVDGFEFNEEHGLLDSVKLTYAVNSELTGVAAIEDMRLDDRIPQVGKSLSNISGVDLHHPLVCEGRSFSRVSREASSGLTMAFVEATYRRHYQTPRIVGGSAGVNQIQTQLLPDGTVATVEYDGRQQAGELTVNNTANAFSIRVTEVTNTPEEVADSWVNAVNSSLFRGGSPGTWTIAGADYEAGLLSSANADASSLYTGLSLWHFAYRFEHNPDGWDPTAAYKDPETGEFPADLVVGTGIKTFEYYFRKDLNNLFKPRWTGPTPTSPPAPVIPPVV